MWRWCNGPLVTLNSHSVWLNQYSPHMIPFAVPPISNFQETEEKIEGKRLQVNLENIC